MSDANGGPNTADPSERWTVRGIGPDTRRKAADMADKADVTLGQWLSRLIERAADKATVADVQADDLALMLARLERLERAVFTADSQSTVSYIVNGKRQPDADIIAKLGKLFPQLL